MPQQDDRTILVVDDEHLVRGLISKILRADGHRTMEAADGAAAYELVRQYHKSLALVVTDIQMPRMKGTELADRVEIEFPAIAVLLISGYAEPESSGRRCLRKPFTSKSLRAAVREILEAPSPAPEAPAVTPIRPPSDFCLRLAAAQEKLEAADREYAKLAEQASDAVDNLLDGQLALRQAIAVRQAAYEEYLKALRECTESLAGIAHPKGP